MVEVHELQGDPALRRAERPVPDRLQPAPQPDVQRGVPLREQSVLPAGDLLQHNRGPAVFQQTFDIERLAIRTTVYLLF